MKTFKEHIIGEVAQDKEIKDREGTQPKKYYAGDMAKSTKKARARHFEKGKKGPAPGDASAKTKPSKHTKKYDQMFGEAQIEGLKNKAEKSGIKVPIVPGLMPITNFDQNMKFAQACGASIPKWLLDLFSGLEEDLETKKLLSASVAIEQVKYLAKHGVNEFHFYTLNRPELTFAICKSLGIK